MKSMRELVIEYLTFAFTNDELMEHFHTCESELATLSDVDLLEMYDQTLILHKVEGENSGN
jgi:hypothetical protein